MCLILGLAGRAIPADKTPVLVTQSDGTMLTLMLVGDEFFHYNTTVDGYTVLRNQHGSYEYARRDGDHLRLSGTLAHDPGSRTQAEEQLLEQTGKHVRSLQGVLRGRKSRAKVDGPSGHSLPWREPVVDYANFRGLIILINYTDRQFMVNEPHDFYDKMVNEEGFDHFVFNGRRQNCTGSMHDYFKDQSGGIFAPTFDIVGPINIDYACTAHNGTENSGEIFKAAVDAADAMVDFSQYDNNGDGVIDMVYFLVAGYSANYNGNNGGYLWPHQSWLFDWYNNQWYEYDGVTMGRYASSTEIYGWESQGNPMPLGIGTMCHEFSHVLGLPDLYDTNYSDQGQSHDPGEWDIMASGGSNNYGRTPCAYSIWERYALGWSQPQEVAAEGSFELRYVGNTGDGLILRTPVQGEFFMLDNRQRIKWDAYLPGHGMLIARVDSTNRRAWQSNKVNADPSHNYYELLRAGNGTSGSNSSDPFPGAMSITTVDNFTQPSLKTWAGLDNPFRICNITEADGTVTLDVRQVEIHQTLVEDFQAMPVVDEKHVDNVAGNFAKWTFKNAHVQDIPDESSNHAAAMYKGSLIVMTTPLLCDAFYMRFAVVNPTNVTAKFTVYRSIDQTNWIKVNSTAFEVAGNETLTFNTPLSVDEPTYFRINMTAGSAISPVFVDDVTFLYRHEFAQVRGDVTGDGVVDVADINLIISMMLGKAAPSDVADLTGDGAINVADVNVVINCMLGK